MTCPFNHHASAMARLGFDLVEEEGRKAFRHHAGIIEIRWQSRLDSQYAKGGRERPWHGFNRLTQKPLRGQTDIRGDGNGFPRKFNEPITAAVAAMLQWGAR